MIQQRILIILTLCSICVVITPGSEAEEYNRFSSCDPGADNTAAMGFGSSKRVDEVLSPISPDGGFIRFTGIPSFTPEWAVTAFMTGNHASIELVKATASILQAQHVVFDPASRYGLGWSDEIVHVPLERFERPISTNTFDALDRLWEQVTHDAVGWPTNELMLDGIGYELVRRSSATDCASFDSPDDDTIAARVADLGTKLKEFAQLPEENRADHHEAQLRHEANQIHASISAQANLFEDDCPLEPIHTGTGSIRWGPLGIGDNQLSLEGVLDQKLELRSNLDSPGQIAQVQIEGLEISLIFRESNVGRRLSGFTLTRPKSNSDTCWDLDSLRATILRKLPEAKYLPSRHDPDVAELDNPFPMYVVDEAQNLVILLKPSQGGIYFGKLEGLD